MLLAANILAPLTNVLESIIKFLHDDVGFTWGMSIVGLTFIVRLAVLPLSLRGIRSMRRMQVVAPQIQGLKERYKDDPQRFQRETMELYKREGVNPLSSCLPFALQFPFFIAIYQLLRGSTFKADVMASGTQGFLGVQSVIEKPQGAELVVLIVLFVVTTSASVLLTTAASPTGSPAQRYMMLAFPLIIVPFIARAPAGLAIYWIATNIFSLAQQAVVQRVMPVPPPPTPEEVQAAKAPPPPPRKRKRRR